MVDRREFTALAALAGLSALVAPEALLGTLRRFALPAARADEPLLAGLQATSERLARHEITPETFVREVQARLAAAELPAEVQNLMSPQRAITNSAIKGIWSKQVGASRSSLLVFLVAPRQSHPAHAHHDAASVQCVVRGRLHVRQYERVRRLDPTTLALRPTSDHVCEPYETILTTERRNNVHWFGAEDTAAVVVNYNVTGGLRDTFDPVGVYPPGRYYVDATVSQRVDGLIAAPQLTAEDAERRFARQPLSAFASPLAPAPAA